MPRAIDNWLELPTRGGGTIKVLKAVHPRARRLRLTVTPSGARLSYPSGTHASQVFAFLRQHAEWLETKYAQMHVGGHPPAPLKPGTPTLIPLRGVPTKLVWGESDYPGAALLDGELCLAVPRPFSRALPLARNLLADYLETQMRRDIARWLGGYAQQLGRAPTGLRIRPLKSLWGSLDGRDRITLDLALALAPRAALRYVLIHELCHLRVRDHSPRFWRRVGELMPGYQAQRDWLRANGGALKAEIERLI